jgi:hypothetical protein
MDQSPPPPPPDAAPQLRRDLYHQIAHALRAALPPPLADTWQERDRRDRIAIGLAGTLCPVNAEEATIAAHYVVANAHGMDCMRLLQESVGTPAWAKLDAQAHRAMREARGARSLLLRVQTARRRRAKDAAACIHDEWAEHIAVSLMTETLDQAPPAPVAAPPSPEPAPVAAPLPPMPAPVAAPSPEQVSIAAPSPAPAPVATPSPMPAAAAAPPYEPAPITPPLPPMPAPAAAPPQAQPSSPPRAPKQVKDAEPFFDLAAEAERYAIIYPRRAELIRRLGGLPYDCNFGPPEPELVRAIVTGTSPALRELDRPAVAVA